jgi:hypothetical protein
MPSYVDNEAAVNMIRNWISKGRTRHAAVQINFLRDLQESGVISIENIAGTDNRADIGTKHVDRTTFERHGVPMHGKDKYYEQWK